MGNLQDNATNQAVSSYLLRPLRDLRYVQLENVARRAWADGWARGQDEDEIAQDVLQSVRRAFPEMSASEAASAIRRLRAP